MKKLDEITIADLMPDSISQDAQVSATARAIDPQLRLVSEAVGKPLILYSIDDLDAGVLEHLAVQYDVTAWDSAWPIDTKRAVLKTAIADKRKKGTRGAVQRAIEAIAPVATITEWWQADPPETPHTFRIDVLQDGSPVDAETQADVIAQVNEAKPVRSHFTFNVGQLLGGDLYLSGVFRGISYARVRDSGIVLEQMGIRAGILAAMRGMSIRRILAETEMGEMPEPTPSVDTLELVLGMRSSGSGSNAWQSVTYSTTTGYWGGITNEADRKTAEEFGLQVHTNKWAGTIGGILNDYTYSIELLAVYSDMGETPVTKGDTWFFRNGTTSDASLVYMIIANSAGFSTSVKSYKARFIKRDETQIVLYFNTDKTAKNVSESTTAYTLYDEFGKQPWYDAGYKYTLLGVYNADERINLDCTFTLKTSASPAYSYLSLLSREAATVTHVIVKVERLQNRVAYFYANGTDYYYNSSTSNLYAIMGGEYTGANFVENFERVLDIVRIETSDGTAIEESMVNKVKLQKSSASSLKLQIARFNSSVSFTAARVIYRSYPLSMFPTITTGGDFGTYNWLTVSSGSPETINGGENSTDLAYSGVTPSYDSTKQYAVLVWREASGVNGGYGQFTIANVGGKLQAHNNTNQALTFYMAQVAVCHSTDAVVVTVYGSNNKPYSAFRVQVDGKYFYNILSGSVSAWTSRIESLGYHL